MQFVYDQELLAYMKEKKKHTLMIEVITSDSSDFEFTELRPHFITEKFAEYCKTKKRYRGIKTEHGEVLLPPYRLEYADTITFRLKKFWIFRSVVQEGIFL